MFRAVRGESHKSARYKYLVLEWTFPWFLPHHKHQTAQYPTNTLYPHILTHTHNCYKGTHKERKKGKKVVLQKFGYKTSKQTLIVVTGQIYNTAAVHKVMGTVPSPYSANND